MGKKYNTARRDCQRILKKILKLSAPAADRPRGETA
jgi:hypothetical protein